MAALSAIAIAAAAGGCSVFGDDDDTPLAMYTAPGTPSVVHQMAAYRVQLCWFGGKDPAFAEHTYDISADSARQMGQITVLKGTLADKMQGDAEPVFVANFRSRGKMTEIDFPVQPKDQTFSARLKTDVIRWANGSEGC